MVCTLILEPKPGIPNSDIMSHHWLAYVPGMVDLMLVTFEEVTRIEASWLVINFRWLISNSATKRWKGIQLPSCKRNLCYCLWTNLLSNHEKLFGRIMRNLLKQLEKRRSGANMYWRKFKRGRFWSAKSYEWSCFQALHTRYAKLQGRFSKL